MSEESITKFEKDAEFSKQQVTDLDAELEQKKESLNEATRLSKSDGSNLDAARDQMDE